MTEEKTHLVEKQEDAETTPNTVKGIIAAVIIVILFATSATAVQLLERRIPDLELNTFRSAGPFLTCTIFTLISRNCPLVPREEIFATILYTLDIFIGALFYFVAFSLLPAAVASCITYTSGVVSAFFIFSLFWNEKITIRNVMFALISVLGVVMVIQPWEPNIDVIESVTTDEVANASFIAYGNSPSDENMYASVNFTTDVKNNTFSASGSKKGLDSNNSLDFVIGCSFSIISGVAFTLELLIVKWNPFLGDRHVFWAFLANTLLSAALMLALETPVLPSNWFDAAMVIIHSMECAIMWRLYIYAPKHISGNTLTLILTSDVVVSLIFQYTVLSSIHPGHKNWIEVVGVILVLVGCSVSSLLELLNTKTSET